MTQDTAALVERVRAAVLVTRPDVRPMAEAALDSLTARITELEKMTVDPDISACLSALERAERERDELRRRVDDNWTQSAYDACCDSRDEAEARAQKAEAELKEESAAKWSARERLQKAEAVVEAARQLRDEGWFASWSEDVIVQALLAALDEEQT